MTDVTIGIVVSSDRASAGIYQDRGGPAIRAYLERVLMTPFACELVVCPDDAGTIAATLRRMADELLCPLILTTGGTGPASRDVTPEATMAVADRMLPGFGEAMRTASLREVPTAILSRQVAATRGRSLIVNLPGNPAAINTCLDAVFAAIPYCIDLIGGKRIDTDPAICRAHRPKT
ncbi:MAG: molybdopterin adenylyltransferase [Hyphomicrobiaceae bacterium]